MIPIPLLPMQYEALIDDLPGKAEAMTDLLDIQFDERMLRFYEQERKVETASLWQVRQPLYSSSVARWKPHQKHPKPLFDILEGAG